MASAVMSRACQAHGSAAVRRMWNGRVRVGGNCASRALGAGAQATDASPVLAAHTRAHTLDAEACGAGVQRRTVYTASASWARVASWEDGTRPFEVTLHDVNAGSDDEWDFGDISDDVWSEEEAIDLNADDILDAHRIDNLYDSPEERFADLCNFRDHLTSAPRVRLPASLASRVRCAAATGS